MQCTYVFLPEKKILTRLLDPMFDALVINFTSFLGR